MENEEKIILAVLGLFIIICTSMWHNVFTLGQIIVFDLVSVGCIGSIMTLKGK